MLFLCEFDRFFVIDLSFEFGDFGALQKVAYVVIDVKEEQEYFVVVVNENEDSEDDFIFTINALVLLDQSNVCENENTQSEG